MVIEDLEEPEGMKEVVQPGDEEFLRDIEHVLTVLTEIKENWTTFREHLCIFRVNVLASVFTNTKFSHQLWSSDKHKREWRIKERKNNKSQIQIQRLKILNSITVNITQQNQRIDALWGEVAIWEDYFYYNTSEFLFECLYSCISNYLIIHNITFLGISSGAPLIIYTDHNALHWLMNHGDQTSRLFTTFVM